MASMTSENHLHAIIFMLLKLFFRAMDSIILFTEIIHFVCLSTWLLYLLTLLAQVPQLSDVQVPLHREI